MLIYCAYGGSYGKLARALGNSVVANCPDANVLTERIEPVPDTGPRPLTGWIVAQMQAWLRVAHDCDEPLVLMDADMLVLRDISDVFDRDFDVAVTVRPEGLNSGILFLRPNERSRWFMRAWQKMTALLLERPDGGEHFLHGHYGSVDQAAMMILLGIPVEYGCMVLKLDCSEWNACQEHWDDVGDETRMLHVKGRLRDDVMAGRPGRWPHLVEMWEGYA